MCATNSTEAKKAAEAKVKAQAEAKRIAAESEALQLDTEAAKMRALADLQIFEILQQIRMSLSNQAEPAEKPAD